MQERGDLVRDAQGRRVEGPALDWEMLPAQVEAVIAERIGRLPQHLRELLAVGGALQSCYGEAAEEVVVQLARHFQEAGVGAAIGFLSQWIPEHDYVEGDACFASSDEKASKPPFVEHVYIKIE